MPTFEIGLPDGRKMRANAETEADALAGAQAWWAQQQAAPAAGSTPAAGARAAAEDQRPVPEPDRADWGGMPTPEDMASDRGNIPNLAERFGNSFMMNWGDEVAATAGALPNLLTRGAVGKDRQTILRDIRERQKRYAEEDPRGAAGADVAGGIAGALTLPGGLARWSLGAAPGLLRSAGVGAALSAPAGALDATGRLEGDAGLEDYADAAGEGALEAGGIGALFGGTGNAVGRVAGPWAREAAQYLSDRGVRLTPGQLIGGNAQRAGDAMTSVPFLGNMIRQRQTEGVESFNRGAYDEALAPMRSQGRGARMAADVEMGHPAQVEAETVFNRRYGVVVPRMHAQADAPFRNDIATISTALPQTIRPQFADAFRRHVMNNLDPNTGALTGRALQDSLQGLRTEARRLRSNPGHAYDVDLANSLEEMRTAIENSAGRYTPARTMSDFQRINQAYGRYATLRDASSRLGAEEGVFSPAQMLNAVRTADSSVGKGRFARGDAPMQEYAEAGRSVMRRQVGDSGSPERAAYMALLAAPGAVVAPQATLGAAGALGTLAAAYSRPGNRAFQHLATYSPQTRMAIRRAIERATGQGAPAAGILTERQD